MRAAILSQTGVHLSADLESIIVYVTGACLLAAVLWTAKTLLRLTVVVQSLEQAIKPDGGPSLMSRVDQVSEQVRDVRENGSDKLDQVLGQARKNEQTAWAATAVAFGLGWLLGAWRQLVGMQTRRRRRGRL